jgi:hypothetical protein
MLKDRLYPIPKRSFARLVRSSRVFLCDIFRPLRWLKLEPPNAANLMLQTSRDPRQAARAEWKTTPDRAAPLRSLNSESGPERDEQGDIVRQVVQPRLLQDILSELRRHVADSPIRKIDFEHLKRPAILPAHEAVQDCFPIGIVRVRLDIRPADFRPEITQYEIEGTTLSRSNGRGRSHA